MKKNTTTAPGKDHWRTAGMLALYIREHQEFSYDDFFKHANSLGVSKNILKRICSNLIKGYASVGAIQKKAGAFKISDISKDPIPVWLTTK
jgi:hypothetical protein